MCDVTSVQLRGVGAADVHVAMETSAATLSVPAGECDERTSQTAAGVTRLAPPPTVLSPAPSHTMSPPLSDPPCDPGAGHGRPDPGHFTGGSADGWLSSSVASPGGTLRFFNKTGRVLLELTHVPLVSPVSHVPLTPVPASSSPCSISPPATLSCSSRAVSGAGRWVFSPSAPSTYWPPVVNTVTAPVERAAHRAAAVSPSSLPGTCSRNSSSASAGSVCRVTNSSAVVRGGSVCRKSEAPVRRCISPATCQLLLPSSCSLLRKLPSMADIRRLARSPTRVLKSAGSGSCAGAGSCEGGLFRLRRSSCRSQVCGLPLRLSALVERLASRTQTPANRKRHSRRVSDSSDGDAVASAVQLCGSSASGVSTYSPRKVAATGEGCGVTADSCSRGEQHRRRQTPHHTRRPRQPFSEQQKRASSKSEKYSIDALLASDNRTTRPKQLFSDRLAWPPSVHHPPPSSIAYGCDTPPLLSPTLGTYWPSASIPAAAGFGPPRAHLHMNSVGAACASLTSPSALARDLVHYRLSPSVCTQESPLNLSKR